jgi:putative DNA primase/helicase
LREITAWDDALIAFLRRVSGYAATGLIREHALFFLHGTGGNGKSVFIDTLVAILSDYAALAPMETFIDTHGDRHPTELAMLRGKRLVVAQETEQGRAWAESKIKALTGGGKITARFMRQDFFEFEPQFTLLIAGNHKARLRNVDEAIRRRFHLIPFTVTIPKEQRDTALLATLEREAAGILTWIVQGAREYFAQGLNPPPCVRDATEDYFSEEDSFAAWIADNCETSPTAWDTAGRLFGNWKVYAEAAGMRAGDQKAFAAKMEAAGFERGREGRKGRHWRGIALSKEADQPPEDWASR